MVLRRNLLVAGLLAPVGRLARGADAAALLARASQRYAGLNTYQDEGSVRFPLLPTSEQEITFKTAYVRPDLFRFQWSSGHPFPPLRHMVTRHVIGSDGQRAYSWVKYPGKPEQERTEESLGNAVAGATGVSMGSAHASATLLVDMLWKDQPFGGSILNVSSAVHIGTESVDGVMCDRIRGADRRGDAIDLWIGAEDSLVRRTERQLNVKFVEVRTRIIVDAEIERSRFDPPRRSS